MVEKKETASKTMRLFGPETSAELKKNVGNKE